MARYYGSGSKYLLAREMRNFFLALGLIVLPFAVVLVIIKNFQPAYAIVAGIAAIVVIVNGLDPAVDYFQSRAGKFRRGRAGEKDIKKELLRLPDEFAVFQGVRIGEKRGDIDFVVVGPTGIFTVEAKSMGGKIAYDGMRLTINGNYDGRDFLRQAAGEAWAVKKYLAARLNADLYVHAVLAFSHKFASMRFGLQPVQGGVYAVPKDYLTDLILSFSPYQYRGASRQAIEALLKIVAGSK
ncbi:MAG TPA: nuclease-related domain-containing protein [Patescibacteria group bacterium]|nr:nuclease-related domain-containing protein [Patescibacteria group bacterium]